MRFVLATWAKEFCEKEWSAEMSVDDSYEKLIIDGKVIVKVQVLNKDFQLTWADSRQQTIGRSVCQEQNHVGEGRQRRWEMQGGVGRFLGTIPSESEGLT